MKKLVTLALVAMLVVSALFVMAACDTEPLANPEAHYILAGGHPGWGLEGGVAPTDTAVANRLFTAISLGDARVKSIKGQLKGVKYLYALDWTYEGEAGWTNNFVMSEGATGVDYDGNLLVKVIKYTSTQAGDQTVWTPTWYSSPEAGKATVSLTPDTLWMPEFAENPANGTSGWNSNGVLLKGLGKYTIVFAEFEDGHFGIAAIKLA